MKEFIEICPNELKNRVEMKGISLNAQEAEIVSEVVTEMIHENREDGLFTLVSLKWRTQKGKYVRVSIPW